MKNTQMIRICGDLKGHVQEEREETDETTLCCEADPFEPSDNIVVVQQERTLETVAA